VEYLGDAGPRGRAGNRDVDIGTDQRGFEKTVVLTLEQERTRLHFSGLHKGSHPFEAGLLRLRARRDQIRRN
jgi:hypothetical protein